MRLQHVKVKNLQNSLKKVSKNAQVTMIKPIDRLYEFGSFRLDTVNKTLLRNGKALQLNPKTYEMLLLFVLNSERLIDKKEFLKTLWQDNFVDDVYYAQTED
jgi:DNA-binding response OmpR family regulator